MSENVYDFQVNDKVYDLMFGEGLIYEESQDSLEPDDKTIRCRFINSKPNVNFWYNPDGTLISISGTQTDFEPDTEFSKINRTLFHGRNILKKVPGQAGIGKLIITEVPPVRYPWVNIYIATEGNTGRCPGGVVVGPEHNSKEKAMGVSCNEYPYVSWIDSIQLKPGDPVNDKVE